MAKYLYFTDINPRSAKGRYRFYTFNPLRPGRHLKHCNLAEAYFTHLGRLKLIVCFASGFLKNPMRECENKTHSMKNYTEILGSKDKNKDQICL